MNPEPTPISTVQTPAPSAHSIWSRKSTILCLLLAVGIFIATTFPMMEAPTNPLDEGLLLLYPELLTKGLLPQRDYENIYPPGDVWLLAGAYKVMGTDIFAERTVGMLYEVLLICGIYCLLVPRGRTAAVAACLISTAILSRLGFPALAWIGALALSALALAILTRPGDPRQRAIFTGILAGLAVTWRMDIAPALFLAIGGYFFLAKWRWQEWLRLVLAGAAALIPLLSHILIVTPAVFFNNIFYDPVIRTHGARSLPLDYSGAYAGQLYVLIILGIAAALTVGWLWRKGESPEGLALFAAGAFALGIMSEGLQREDSAHLSLVAAFTVPLLVYAASFLSRSQIVPVAVAAATLFSTPQTLDFLRVIHTQESGILWVKNGDRQVSGSIEEQAAVNYLQSHAAPGQRLFVGTQDLRYTVGNNTAFYHLFPQLLPATYFLEFEPHVANRPGSRLASDLATADWVVLDRTWEDSPEPNTSHTPGPNAPNEVLQKDFHLVYHAGVFQVYRKLAG